MDYQEIGFKAGIEIHQQLDTKKLFCRCPSKIRDREPDLRVKRKMRAVEGEIGDVDPAALHEFLKNRSLVYEAYADTNCLVELDEEPPHPVNEQALKIVLQVAMMLNARIVDEIHVMRKTVIDGSNTSGFQRTMLVAKDGYIETEKGRVRIPDICLEEDAARKIDKEGHTTYYRLDRLGIPLIEIGTAPDIKDPEHAKEVARKLGMILRATGRVKRGLGTIRQDLNISVKDGQRIEVKGVQNLAQIEEVLSNEARRHLMLLEVKQKLEERGISEEDLDQPVVDVSSHFQNTDSKLFKGKSVFGIRLPGFNNLLRGEGQLGPELAQYAKSKAGVKGIIHSDELPGYGLSAEEVNSVSKELSLQEEDAFALVIAKKKKAEDALEEVLARSARALNGVPDETRRATEEGDTEFMRPLPGSARMYPETDEPLIQVDEKEIRRLKENLPKKPDELYDSYLQAGLNEELANQVLNSRYNQFFLQVLEEYSNLDPKVVATTLTSTLKYVHRKHDTDISSLDEEDFLQVFSALSKEKISKDAIDQLLLNMIENPNLSAEEIIEKEDLGSASRDEVEEVVEEVINENEDFIKEQGMRAIGPLTGQVMGRFQGAVDGKLVSDLIKEKIDELAD